MKKKDALLRKLGQSLEKPAAASAPIAPAASAKANPAASAAPRAKPSASTSTPHREPTAAASSPVAPTASSSSSSSTAAKAAPASPTASASSTASPHPLHERAEIIVARAVPWSMGAGLIPVPLADSAAVVALQIKLLRELCELYSKPFADHQARAILASLAGGALPAAIAGASLGMFLKFVPGIGTLLGIATFSATAGATTLAVGKIFIAHFETGGSLFDVDRARLQESFSYRYTEARRHWDEVADALKP
jgi:uncharacterized protein (DUF697 family)